MSIKKQILMLLLAAALAPAAALADSVSFGYSGGVVHTQALGNTRITNDPFVAGLLPEPQAEWSTLTSISSSTGVVLNGALGDVIFYTGPFMGQDPSDPYTTLLYPGGEIKIIASAEFEALTGIPAGTILFQGQFSDVTRWTQLDCFDENCTGPIHFLLSGLVTGQIHPALLAYLGLDASNFASDSTFHFSVVLASWDEQKGPLETGEINLHTPEPGTLTLFGSGLLMVAGLLRRRRNS
jgi:hypothetical protein